MSAPFPDVAASRSVVADNANKGSTDMGTIIISENVS